jgi:uncharacterized protein
LSQQFFVKLIPRRATFAQDMTDAERAIMQQHIEYWTGLMQKQIVVVFGPVMDPAGVYGMGVVETESEESLNALLDADPAKAINDFAYCPMRAVHPGLKN